MEKLKMHTPDLTQKNIEQIAKLFPNVITEIKDENGTAKKGIDFDLLKQNLSDILVEDENERYRLDWPGKKVSLLKANTPITKTLIPVIGDSVDFENTKNLFIEGDNFEVLKILQESYLGKIKMIYIDPPYNTGSDFIFRDVFKVSEDEYKEEIGAVDEDGEKLFKNTDSNGRFHSDWLSMMYERLIIARDLLKKDGVIFISIDENEVHNLRKICDEVLGEDNFISQAGWQKVYSTKNQARFLSNDYEFVLIYAKMLDFFEIGMLPRTKEMDKRYSNPDNDPRGNWKPGDLVAAGERTGGHYIVRNPFNAKEYDVPPGKHWAFSEVRMKELLADNRIYWGVNNDSLPSFKQFLKEVKQGRVASSFFSYKEYGHTDGAKKEFIKLFGEQGKTIFETVKPVKLIQNLLRISNLNNNDIVLDFFSGSATTADAVIQLNAEQGSNYKFIMVQMPEQTDENSEAFKAGYKTIAEIGKERIRRAGKKIKEELEAKNKQLVLGKESVDADNLDIGFRVYKTDSSNMKDVFYHPSELKQDQLSMLESNIKEDRSPEDILTQVILDLGLELSLPIEKKEILGNNVFIVQQNALVACFDDDINFKIVDEIAVIKPFKVVFRDSSFKDDKDRINVEERFKRLSPETRVTVI